MIAQIDEKVLRDYFARLDALVSPGTVLYVFGGGAVALIRSRSQRTSSGSSTSSFPARRQILS